MGYYNNTNCSDRLTQFSYIKAPVILWVLFIVTSFGFGPDALATPDIKRGEQYYGTPERFNRYYTDTTWKPGRIIYVSNDTSSTDLIKQSYDNPVTIDSALNNLQPGDLLFFKKSRYPYRDFNINLSEDMSGTYDNPVVLYGERDINQKPGVKLYCARGRNNARSSCINLEGTNYIAIDGFEMVDGYYGVRSVGISYTSNRHQLGIAILNNISHGQYKDPIFTAQSDWTVVESNTAYNAQKGDGHGIYISNGSDWVIIRHNHLYQNSDSDLQINADPISTCLDIKLDYYDKRCYGNANNGNGQGVSEFIRVIRNYLHNGKGQGPNFTSVRNSVFKGNIIGPYARHGTSFWQQTPNPELGSSGNTINNNIFVGYRPHILQFVRHSNNNIIDNNLFISLSSKLNVINQTFPLLELDETTSNNVFKRNIYLSGTSIGKTLHKSETKITHFDNGYFTYNYTGSNPTAWLPSDSFPASGFSLNIPDQLPPFISGFSKQ